MLDTVLVIVIFLGVIGLMWIILSDVTIDDDDDDDDDGYPLSYT